MLHISDPDPTLENGPQAVRKTHLAEWFGISRDRGFIECVVQQRGGRYPEESVANCVSSWPTAIGDGTFSVAFELVAEALDDFPLQDVQITDDLTTEFGVLLLVLSIAVLGWGRLCLLA